MHSRLTAVGIHRSTAQQWLRLSVCVALCIVLVACGFRLKGVAPLPFSTLYTNISENSAFGANLRRAITASSPGTRVVNDPQDAQARLIQLANQQTRRELSIDAEGQVEEYELNLEFVFQLTDAQGRIILPTTALRAFREVPYDPDNAQAKQDEIRMIFEDMQQSMVARVVRRLSSPDVIEAFEEAQALPAPDNPQDPVGTPYPLPEDPLNDWENTMPGTFQPFN